MSTVILFDLAGRKQRIATENTVRAALAEFSRLADLSRCRWVLLHGIAMDGRHFHVASHDMCSGALGLNVYFPEDKP